MNGLSRFSSPRTVSLTTRSSLRVSLGALGLLAIIGVVGAFFPAGGMTRVSAQSLSQCPNGQPVAAYQGCYGQGSYTCPGIGIALPAGQCPTVCPSQQIVAPGQPCPDGSSQLIPCPGTSVSVPFGAPCPVNSSQLIPCPGIGVTVPIGTPCPNGSTLTFTCPGTAITLPVGAPCPGTSSTAPTFSCPGTSLLLSVGTPCPSTCPNIQFATAAQNCLPNGFSAPTPPPAPPSLSLLVPAHSAYSATVSYVAGWNIISAPPGSPLTGIAGPLLTFQAGDTAYEVVPAGSALRPGAGYWAYASGPVTSALAPSAQTSVTVQVPPHQYVMVGNPGNTIANVDGADVVLIYTPSTASYTQATTLAPGQGGWAGSFNGALVTITNAPS